MSLVMGTLQEPGHRLRLGSCAARSRGRLGLPVTSWGSNNVSWFLICLQRVARVLWNFPEALEYLRVWIGRVYLTYSYMLSGRTSRLSILSE